MSQLNFHKTFEGGVTPPPTERNFPIIHHLVRIYKQWHEFLPDIPKDARYTIGGKIDSLFLETIESVYTARFLPPEKKHSHVERAATKLDLAKFLLQVIWEIKSLDTKKYILISESLNEIGRMLGGWINQLIKRNRPAGRS